MSFIYNYQNIVGLSMISALLLVYIILYHSQSSLPLTLSYYEVLVHKEFYLTTVNKY